FRLARAAERGERASEEVSVGRMLPGERIRRSLQISVTPYATGDVPSELVLWRVADVTADRRREATRLASVEVQLAQLDNVPVGLASIAADGTLLHVNGTLARWIGRSPKAIAEQHLTLPDIAAGEGSGL